MRSATDAHDVSAKQDRVNAADHERKHTQQRHRSRARGVRAHKGDSDDLDREKRNKSQNVQQDVFHNESLLKDLLRGASDPLLRCQNSTENVCCKIHNFECSLFWF